MGMRVDIATLFPEMCQRVLDESILGRAAKRGYIETHCHQIRDYTLNRQKQTDDYPYGGGCGMVLYAQPIADCIRAIQQQVAEQGRPAPHIVFMTAGGQRYTEAHARRLAQYDSLLLVCGHYEGIDERVIEAFADEEISIGDYILTGGELASLVVADSVLRLQPGVLAEQKGYEEESYWNGLLEYPQYTRPEVWEGRAVPPILLSGNHKAVDDWRGEQSRQRTRERRPDLWEAYLAAGGWDGTPAPKKPSRHRKKKPAAPAPAAVEPIDFSNVEIEPLFEDMVDFETFSKSDFRAVKIKACSAVPKSKKLLQFVLDDGSGTDRVILSGIHAYYEPEELVGKTAIAIVNLPPRKMMGIDSCGMLISAVHHELGAEKLHLLMVDDHIPAGAKLY